MSAYHTSINDEQKHTKELSFYQKWAKKIVLSALQSMTEGHLTITTESGETHNIGKISSNINAVITINNPSFYEKVLISGHIGFSEAYMEGDWNTTNIEAVISWAILNINNSPVLEGSKKFQPLFNIMGGFNKVAHWMKENSIENSQKNIHAHYDLSNDFFSQFLDNTMTYSSAKYLSDNETLEEAQINKYESICQKINLSKDDHVLEIGTGWGGFSIYAAIHYGCKITTVTISEEQYIYAKAKVDEYRLTELINVEFCDYRNITGNYDKLVSIEMIEAVGDKYLDGFMEQCSKLIKPDGIIAIQMITCPDSRYNLLRDNVDFIQKHIFPGSLLPSIGRINQAINTTGDLSLFEIEDLGLSYAKTLRTWDTHFTKKEAEIRKLGFDTTFIRKWHYYFHYCAAAFQMRNISVVQAIYSRPNNLQLNTSARKQVYDVH